MLGQVIPMLAAVVAIPILIRGLGAPRFGVLTLAWAAIGYFSLFDFGLTRALTQSIAARLAVNARDRELSAVAWTAIWLMLGLGTIGGITLWALAPTIVTRWLNVPPELVRESIVVFDLLALSMPLVVTTAGLRGIVEAHQQFGVATALRVPLAVFTFVGPLAVLPFSSSLVPIVAVLVAGRLATWVVHLVVCLRRYPYLRRDATIRWHVLPPLLRFGGWMTVSSAISPLMVYVDRFFIGAILPLAAVTLYVTPFELVTKLQVVPVAAIGVFFPAFASTYDRQRARTAVLFERALRGMLVLMFPLMFLLVLFAGEGLTLWVGADMARESAPVLRWLAIGMFVNTLAQAPFAVLQGAGRPDLTARLHLLELPIYAVALWWLAHRFGIVGVAVAFTMRVALDAGLLLYLACRLVPGEPAQLRRTLTTSAAALGVLALAAVVDGALLKGTLLVAALGTFGIVGWRRVVPAAEREWVRGWSRSSRRDIASPTAASDDRPTLSEVR
jgi:O-antigen/teichoic acid export membrane protein